MDVHGGKFANFVRFWGWQQLLSIWRDCLRAGSFPDSPGLSWNGFSYYLCHEHLCWHYHLSPWLLQKPSSLLFGLPCWPKMASVPSETTVAILKTNMKGNNPKKENHVCVKAQNNRNPHIADGNGKRWGYFAKEFLSLYIHSSYNLVTLLLCTHPSEMKTYVHPKTRVSIGIADYFVNRGTLGNSLNLIFF